MTRPLARAAVLGLALAAPASAQDPHFSFLGDGASEFFGRSVRAAGDVDGDGFADVVVGIPRDDTNGSDAGMARVYSGERGTLLWEWLGDGADDQFGVSVAGVGDVDGDGHDDVLVGAYETEAGAGYARLFSGATGSALHTFTGESFGDEFGEYVAEGGDVNGDSVPDVVIGAPDHDGNRGAVYVFEADGGLLHKFVGPAPNDNLGITCHGGGDVNGDGFMDVVGGAFLNDAGGNAAGRVFVYSGRNGSILHTFTGASPGDRLGIAVDISGDANGDGFADVLAGAYNADDSGPDSGSAWLFSGQDGSLLGAFFGDGAGDQLGISVAFVGDVDGDERDDVVIGSFLDDPLGPGSDTGSAYLYSGSSGAELFHVDGPGLGDHFGREVDGLGDVNGDGIPDLVASGPSNSEVASKAGNVRVFSGRPLRLVSDRHELSLSAGGTQTLALHAGAAHAGAIYWVFGSFTGTSPGIDLGFDVLPLNVDELTFLTIQQKNTGVWSNTLALLDGNGDATATFNIPPGTDPSVAGLTFHYAYATYDALIQPDFVSNAVPVTMRP